MNEYLVIGIALESNSRWAEEVQAFDAQEAEELAKAAYLEREGEELTVAAVMDEDFIIRA